MTDIITRKKQHIEIVLNKEVTPPYSLFDEIHLKHKALPDVNLKNIDTNYKFINWNISMPFIVSSMTGGEQYGRTINENLAIACEQEQIGFGLGSMRVILEKPESLKSFQIKKLAPTVPVFGNIGIVQLNYGVGLDEIRKIIELTQIDGLFVHVNALQEAIQPEGDTNFEGVLDKFSTIVSKIKIPIIVKEVGHGLDVHTIKSLKDIGIKWFDVSGTGGTSWAKVEGYRLEQEMNETNLGQIFENFGLTTVEAILDAQKIDGINIIAGGGIRNGLDLAKALVLGATMGTSARPFLKAALDSNQKVIEIINMYRKSLKIAMFMTNSKNLQDLRKVSVLQNTAD